MTPPTSYRNAEDGFALVALERLADNSDAIVLRAVVYFLGDALVRILDAPDLDAAQRVLRDRMGRASRGELGA